MILIAKTFKVKIVIGGEASFEKNSFLNRTTLVEEEIGVSFKSLECIINDRDSYKLIMWDLNPAKEIFGFMYPQFCKGAKTCLLFFDYSQYASISELPYWIDLFRKTLGETIPIILIGTFPELRVQEVYEEDIEKVISDYHLHPEYFVIPHDDASKNIKKKNIFKRLIKNINPECEINKFKIISPCEDPAFIDFFLKFSRCPVCNRQNHERYLQDLFYSQDDEKVRLKNYLLDLLENIVPLPHHPHLFELKIGFPFKVGIPCCSCYQKIFHY